MDLDDLVKEAFSIIKDNDPYKESKQLQIRNWGRGYLETINTGNLPFFRDILSDEECWEKADAIHGIKLNRRVVAKKMIKSENWKGTINPLEDFDRYQVACWCCLEDEIKILFERFKQKHEVEDGDSDALKKLARRMSGSWYTDAMMEFWSHYISGCISELDLKDQHPYVFGLHRAAVSSNRRRVEAVEFFWDKVKLLPESELNTQEKDEVFMKIAVHAAKDSGYPDVFEFCLGKISPDRYPELLKRDFEENLHYGSLNRMKDMHNFDKFQELFDCLKPSDISEDCYHTRLCSIEIQNYSGHYIDAAEKLFMHMWMKEGFDRHRAFVIKEEVEEVIDPSTFFDKNLLVHWVEKGCVKAVWTVLNQLSSDQKERQVNYIHSILAMQGDSASLDRFLADGKSADKELYQKSIPGSSILAQGDSASLDGNKSADKEPYREDIPGPSGDLTEAKVKETHGHSRIE